jgi:hypothetical protein
VSTLEHENTLDSGAIAAGGCEVGFFPEPEGGGCKAQTLEESLAADQPDDSDDQGTAVLGPGRAHVHLGEQLVYTPFGPMKQKDRDSMVARSRAHYFRTFFDEQLKDIAFGD